MIPKTPEDVVREEKERYSKTEQSCKYCGLELLDDSAWEPRCMLDALGRDCEGKCKYYEQEKPMPRAIIVGIVLFCSMLLLGGILACIK